MPGMCYNVVNLRILFLIVSASYASSPGCSSNSPTRHLCLLALLHFLHCAAKERSASPFPSTTSPLFAKTREVASTAFPKFQLVPSHSLVYPELRRATKFFRSNTYSRSPRRVPGLSCNPARKMDRNQPNSPAHKRFGCNTYRLHTCNPFIRNTYKKTPGEWETIPELLRGNQRQQVFLQAFAFGVAELA